MVSFNAGELEALKGLVCPEEEDEGHVYGSALNPATASGREKKEVARPNVAVQVKTFNRAA